MSASECVVIQTGTPETLWLQELHSFLRLHRGELSRMYPVYKVPRCGGTQNGYRALVLENLGFEPLDHFELPGQRFGTKPIALILKGDGGKEREDHVEIITRRPAIQKQKVALSGNGKGYKMKRGQAAS